MFAHDDPLLCSRRRSLYITEVAIANRSMKMSMGSSAFQRAAHDSKLMSHSLYMYSALRLRYSGSTACVGSNLAFQAR